MCGPLFFHWGCAGDRLTPIPANSKGTNEMKLTKEQITEKREELCKVHVADGGLFWKSKKKKEKVRRGEVLTFSLFTFTFSFDDL